MENKTGKYLKYAIGEIILVVIGILIALSINTWNENIINKKEASFQLSKLRDNLNSDKEQLKAAIVSNNRYIDDLIFCVNVISNDIEATSKEFIDHLQYISTTMKFDPTRSAFDGLISSGKIELINNHDLLETLFSYYSNTTFRSWDSALKDYSRNIIMPYFLGFDHISNVTDENESEYFTQFDITKFDIPSKSIDDYKNNLFVINALRQKIQLFEGQRSAYKALLNDIDSLIKSINEELNN